jgi:hypothetical protein
VQTAFRLCFADMQKMQHSLEVANKVIQEIQFPSRTSSASYSSTTRTLRYTQMQSPRMRCTGSRNSLLEMNQCPDVPCPLMRGNELHDSMRGSQGLVGEGQLSVRLSSFLVSGSEASSEIQLSAQKYNDRAAPAAQRSLSTGVTSPMQARSRTQVYPKKCQTLASLSATNPRRHTTASTRELSDSKIKLSQMSPLKCSSSSNTRQTSSAIATFPESQSTNKHHDQHCDGPYSACISEGSLSLASLRGTGAVRHSTFYSSTKTLGRHAACPCPLHPHGDKKGVARLNMHAQQSTDSQCEIETDRNSTQSTASRQQCLDNIPSLRMKDEDSNNCEGTVRDSDESDSTGFQSLHASECRTQDSNDSKKYSMDSMPRISNDSRKFSMHSMHKFRCDLQMCVHLEDEPVPTLQFVQLFE